MSDNCIDDEFSYNNKYCNVHGYPLVLLESDNGDLYIKLKDFYHSGFAVFGKKEFSRLSDRKEQLTQEFELFVYSAAIQFIVENKIQEVTEEDLLEEIENAKKKLRDINPFFFSHSPRQTSGGTSRNNYQNQGRQWNKSPKGNNNYVKTFQDTKLPQNTNQNSFKQEKTFQKFNNNHKEDLSISQPSSSKSHNNNRNYKKKNFNSSPRSNNSDCNEESASSSSKSDLNESMVKNRGSRNLKPNSNFSNNEIMMKHEHLEKESLEIGKTYQVQVCYVEPEKSNLCWIHKAELLPIMGEMFLEIEKQEKELEELTNPQRGQLVIAFYDDGWFRGRIINPSPLTVFFCDYGNRSTVTKVKLLPNNFKKFPCFAIRSVVNGYEEKLEEGLDMTVRVSKKYEHPLETYVIDVKNVKPIDIPVPKTTVKVNSSVEEVPIIKNETFSVIPEPVPKTTVKVNSYVEEVPIIKNETFSVTPEPVPKTTVKDDSSSVVEVPIIKNETFSVIPKPFTNIKNGDKMKLVEFYEGKLYGKTKQCVDQLEDLNNYLIKMDIKALESAPKVGQLVLCYRDGHKNLCRAVIREITSDAVATIWYLDYGGCVDVSVRSLRSVDEYLAEHPTLKLEFSQLHYLLKDLGKESIEFLNKTIGFKVKVVISDDGIMDLIMPSEELLSETLKNINNPNPKIPEPKPECKIQEPKSVQSYKRVMYDDMAFIELEMREYDLFCYHIKNGSDVVLTSAEDNCTEYLDKLFAIELEDNEPYSPVVQEICLAFYKGTGDSEDYWYRAVVIGLINDGFLVSLTDFGGFVTLKSDKLRRLPDGLKEIPLLGINCDLGLPNEEPINNKLKEMIRYGEKLTVNVLAINDDFKYKVEVPSINKKLKKLGLI